MDDWAEIFKRTFHLSGAGVVSWCNSISRRGRQMDRCMHSEVGCIGTRVGVVSLQIWDPEKQCNLIRPVDYTAGSEERWYFPKIERSS